MQAGWRCRGCGRRRGRGGGGGRAEVAWRRCRSKGGGRRSPGIRRLRGRVHEASRQCLRSDDGQDHRVRNEGGTVLAIGDAAQGAVQMFKLPLSNHLVKPDGTAVAGNEYYVPGSILRVTVDPKNPLAHGYGTEADIFFNNSPVWKLDAKAGAPAWSRIRSRGSAVRSRCEAAGPTARSSSTRGFRWPRRPSARAACSCSATS